MNIVPREFQGQKPEGPQAPRVFSLGFNNIDSDNPSILGRDFERKKNQSQIYRGAPPTPSQPKNLPQAKNPWGLRPLGFLALELPRDNIHQYTPSAFPHIVSIWAVYEHIDV